ncbi:hypothetical protein ATN89_17665 [Comamonas thiooxydans]|uniref:hypothetical protein n=1 Tax=Comamonas thiooxydans TaxID=363952 RepID=UPI0007C59889|nr:hypothetical protein [Comamonas thiooxydans]OAD82910.1 hypothetical protein ATN89_17665 [Comamonas thiooxydans]
MREIIIDGVIWYAGAIAAVAIMSIVAAIVLWALGHCVNKSARRMLDICRIETGRYWVNRMEKEGLIACNKEYRKLVAERKPKNLKQQYELEAEFDAAKTASQE